MSDFIILIFPGLTTIKPSFPFMALKEFSIKPIISFGIALLALNIITVPFWNLKKM